ncbi:MAG: hypothetical protein ABQ298_03800 [Puniceicoccaceae bacterium]
MADATLDMLLKIRSDLRGLEKGQTELKKTRQAATGLQSTIRKGFGFAAAFVGASLSVGALNAQLTRSIDLASKLSDESFQLQIDPRALQGLNALALDAGISLDIVARGVRHVNTRTVEAQQGTQSYLRAFAQLNIDLAKFARLDTAGKMEAMAVAFANAGNQQKAYAAVSRIIGEEAGPKMLEILQRVNKDGLQPVTKWALAAGLAFDSWELEQLDSVADGITRLRHRISVETGRIIAVLTNDKTRAAIVMQFSHAAQTFGVDLLEAIHDSISFFPELFKKSISSTLSWFDDSIQLVQMKFTLGMMEGLNRVNAVANRLPGLRLGMLDTSGGGQAIEALQQRIANTKLSPLAIGAEAADATFGTDNFAGLRPDEEKRFAAILAAVQEIEAINTRVNEETTRMTANLDSTAISFIERLQEALDNMTEGFATLELSMTNAFGTVVSGAITSLSSGIEGLINRTMTWREALGSIWTGFVGSMVSAFSRMIAEYLVSKATMFAIDKAFAAKSLVMSMASAAKSLVAWIPSAIAASISSFGAASAIGLAAVIGGLAAFGGFKSGGYTGDGDPSAVAGLVHRGEFVLPADVTSRLGVGALNSAVAGIRSGRPGAMAPIGMSGGASAAGGAAGSQRPIYVASFDSRQDARSYLKSKSGEQHIIDIARKHFWEISANAS